MSLAGGNGTSIRHCIQNYIILREHIIMPSLKPLIRFIVIDWPANGSKAIQAGDHHIILAERTVDDEHVSAFISATYDSHMLIIGIEHQIAGLGLIPRDGGTAGVLHVGTAAVAYDVLSIRDIVKYPINKSAAVQSIGSICVGGGVAVRPYLGELAPA